MVYRVKNTITQDKLEKISEILKQRYPEYEEIDDISFEKWDNGLYVKTDNGTTEMISIDTIKNEIVVQCSKKERK